MPLVKSAPPFVQTTTIANGFSLKYPSDQIIKLNSPYEFEVHVFNISNGVPITSGVSCYFHLYNSTGKHQLELSDVTSGHNFDYSFDVSGGNFSMVGDLYYIIQCNNSVLGGFIAVPIEVTPNGLEVTSGRAIIDIGLLLTLIAFFIVSIFIFVYYENLLSKVAMLGVSYLLLTAISFISWNMATDFLLSAPFVAGMFKILFYILIIGALPLFVGAFAWYFLMLWKVKEIESLMTKGFSYDEAERRTGRKYK